MSEGFKIDKATSVLDDWWPASNDKGGTVYVLKLVADVTEMRHMVKLDERFPGCEMMIQDIAARDGPGMELKAKQRLGELNLKLEDKSAQAVVVDIVGGKGWAPILRIGRKAEKVELVHQVTAALPKGVLKDLNDYRKADVLESLIVTQLEQVDLEDEVKRKKKKAGASKNDQVQLDIEDVDKDIDEKLAKPAKTPASPRKKAARRGGKK